MRPTKSNTEHNCVSRTQSSDTSELFEHLCKEPLLALARAASASAATAVFGIDTNGSTAFSVFPHEDSTGEGSLRSIARGMLEQHISDITAAKGVSPLLHKENGRFLNLPLSSDNTPAGNLLVGPFRCSEDSSTSSHHQAVPQHATEFIRQLNTDLEQLAKGLPAVECKRSTGNTDPAIRALRRHSQNMTLLLDTIPSPVFHVSQSGEFESGNGAFAETFYGMSKDEVKKNWGCEPFSALPEQTQKALKKNDADVLRTIGAATYKEQVLTHSGEKRLFSLSKSAYSDEDGELLGLVCVMHDQTSVKTAIQEIKRNKEHFNLVAKSALDAIVMIDSKGRVTFWNSAAEKLFQYSSNEMIDKKLHEIVVPESLKATARKALADFSVSGKGSAIGKISQLNAVRKDGEHVPVELSLSRMNMGDEWGAIGIVRDISERKAAEEQLRKSEEQKQLALKGADLGLWDWNIETGNIETNDRWAEILGYKPDEVDRTQTRWRKLHHPEDLPHVLEKLNAHLRGETEFFEAE